MRLYSGAPSFTGTKKLSHRNTGTTPHRLLYMAPANNDLATYWAHQLLCLGLGGPKNLAARRYVFNHLAVGSATRSMPRQSRAFEENPRFSAERIGLPVLAGGQSRYSASLHNNQPLKMGRTQRTRGPRITLYGGGGREYLLINTLGCRHPIPLPSSAHIKHKSAAREANHYVISDPGSHPTRPTLAPPRLTNLPPWLYSFS